MIKFRKKIFLILAIGLLLINLTPICYAQAQSKEEEVIFVAKKAFEDGYYEISLGFLKRFLDNFPSSDKANEAKLLVGECYFYQNKFFDALGEFEDLLKEPFSDNIKDAIFYWIAEVYFKSNNFAKASGFYHNIIDEFPNSSYLPLAYYSLGWCSFQEEKFKEAWDWFKIIEDRYPKEPQAKDASFKIIECLYNLKDYASLTEKARSYLKLFPQDAPRLAYTYFYIAEAEYYLNNFNQSLEFYLKVLKDSRDDKLQVLSRLGSGWSYLKLKEYKETEEEFSSIKEASLDKKGLEALLLGKAVLMMETNRVNEADKFYGQLLDTATDPVFLGLAYLGKAEALYNLAEYQRASALYQGAIKKIAAMNIPLEITDKLHYGLSLVLLKQGEFKDAIKEFQKVAKASGDKIIKAGALIQIGDVYQDSGEYLKAIEVYESILKRYPDSLYGDYVQYQLGSVFLKNGDYNAAIKVFSDFKNKFPASKLIDNAYYTLALAYFKKQDYGSSSKVLEQSRAELKGSDFSPQAAYLLGSNRYNLGDFNRAIELFKETINHSQDMELLQKAEYGIADSFYQLGDEKEALLRFKALRWRYPGSNLTAEVVFWLADYYYRHNEFNLARRYFLSLIQDFPKSNLAADAYYSLGLIAANKSRPQEAIENFKRAMEFNKPELNVKAVFALGDLFYELEDYTQALTFYRKGIVLAPEKEAPALQIKIAESLEAKGDLESAISEYLKASADDKLKTKAFLRLARIYEDKDDFKEAIKFYEKVLAAGDENAAYAKERIDWLESNIRGL